ncbi:hypothetical protein ASPWEDRAFT_683854 [Aspergillus wentii DTO 134E9]|uniref:Uncharacterized protein n=1 Tax=Aspergillus wentii DTO 134E9 TaxID=1073089 RepID=A0A1L9R8A0_ASPWE|nr:uncharacterized protein ASPWEDRAFT_683854 [Aspergillus wentii DTO 134E9]OJJ31139.1 hypothetical protein ASPWEDRAFT_683854 [Aspergillus wentii DTO 134E9]
MAPLRRNLNSTCYPFISIAKRNLPPASPPHSPPTRMVQCILPSFYWSTLSLSSDRIGRLCSSPYHDFVQGEKGLPESIYPGSRRTRQICRQHVCLSSFLLLFSYRVST